MNLCSFSSRSTPACRCGRRDGAARRARRLRARRRCRSCGCRGRPPRDSRSSAATALPPVASIGSIISTKLLLEAPRQLRVVLRRDRGHLVALQADVADARARDQLEHGVEHPEAGAQHRHDDDVGRDPASVRRRRAASRPSPATTGRSRVASAASSRLMRAAMRRNSFRRRRRVAQRDERVVDERMLDEMNGHGRHYTQRIGSGFGGSRCRITRTVPDRDSDR